MLEVSLKTVTAMWRGIIIVTLNRNKNTSLSTDCPSSVLVSPSSGPFKAGDVLTCSCDGYPEPTYQWTDSDGIVVSIGPKITLANTSFSLTCTATGNFTTPCSAVSDTVIGLAVDQYTHSGKLF